MSTRDPDRIAEIKQRLTRSTEGPWAPWYDQDGADHMNHMLMVGNAAAVIPEGESWVEDVDINPIAHVYTPEDREFIAHARSDVEWLLDQLEGATIEYGVKYAPDGIGADRWVTPVKNRDAWGGYGPNWKRMRRLVLPWAEA